MRNNNKNYKFHYNNLKDVLKQIHKYSDKLHKRKVEYAESRIKDPKPDDHKSVTKKFELDGDIIITDPCYIDDWVIPTHSRDTIYGDWSCNVFDLTNKKKKPFSIGEFCADSGQVCVTNISKCNRDNRKKLEDWVSSHKWCATIIKNFKGSIEYVELTQYFAYAKRDYNREKGIFCAPKKFYWEKDTALIINGSGTKDGKKFIFSTQQTGF